MKYNSVWPRRFLRAALFVLLTALVGWGINFALYDNVHSYTRIMLQEMYDAAGTIDTLFLGTSHCYRSFDPAIADAALGGNTFNAGSSQQQPDGSYHLLVEADRQNPLKTVYLEGYYLGYCEASSRSVPLACYLLADYMPMSFNKLEYLWEMGGISSFADLLLPVRHSIAAPEELPELWKAKLTDGYQKGNYRYVTYPGEEEYRGKGFVYTWGSAPGEYATAGDVNPEQPLSDFGQKYLDKITALCADSGIRLVIVTAPLPNRYAANTANYQAYVDTMQSYAAENGLEYWDFTLYKGTDALALGPEDFQDAHHLNGQGAEKFTPVFCDVAKLAEDGEDVSGLFYDTLDEKLQASPDGTFSAGASAG